MLNIFKRRNDRDYKDFVNRALRLELGGRVSLAGVTQDDIINHYIGDSGSCFYDSGSYAVNCIDTRPEPRGNLWLCEYCLSGNDWADGQCVYCGAPMGARVYFGANR